MKTFTLAALCFVVFSAFAQKADFTGNWVFVEQESISGNLYSNGSPKQINISQTATVVNLDKITMGANNTDFTVSEKLTKDGRAVELTTASKRKKTITTTWSNDGNSFVCFTTISSPDDAGKLERKVTDTYSLEYGSLILQRKDENLTNGEVWESKAVYERR
ncbi:hypothetical protein GWC95_15505 [Sediminibacterium roseum]|uniref:Lipocalin-like domain-containing protein n=1 Tax=Sediminibacterium roseum TaxID=1978412 RepID=A0ABW9ZYM3_9BACT|nr:hypothetical protein [Sediminibacterium roseum]NCI51334.1 hypothetical protein [Sediminibacterium roseum]